MPETAASVAIFDECGRVLLVLERDDPDDLPSPRSRALETLSELRRAWPPSP